MRVKIEYTVEASDDWRRAIRNFYGKEGLATRAEIKQWCWMYGSSADDDIMWELQQKLKQEEEEEA